MAETVHVAGECLNIGGRYLRQRCSWCGAVLIDYDLAMMGFSVAEGEEPSPPATWEVGVLVLVDGSMSTTVEHEDGAKLPASSCVIVELDRHELEQLEARLEGESDG